VIDLAILSPCDLVIDVLDLSRDRHWDQDQHIDRDITTSIDPQIRHQITTPPDQKIVQASSLKPQVTHKEIVEMLTE
jgi:hypothetical protein